MDKDSAVVISSRLLKTRIPDRNGDIYADTWLDGKVWSGKYLRTKKFQDDKFTTWVTDEDLSNPPEWMKYFGLVEKEYVDGGYIIKRLSGIFMKNIDLELSKKEKSIPFFVLPPITTPLPISISCYV